MGTRIIQFGVVPGGILAAFTGNGYEVDACGTSLPKLRQALQKQNDLDAIAIAENSAPKAAGTLDTIRSVGKVPLILFQDESRTCDPSQFDLVVSEHTSQADLLKKVESLVSRSRLIRANTKILGERFHALLRESTSLLEQSVTARVEFQRIRAKRLGSEKERVSLASVLVVDDHERWRGTICSMLRDYADCRVMCEAEDGVEAVQRATELKPQLILLDLSLPHLNGIAAARQIAQLAPDSAIIFVSMNNCAEVVSEALSTGAKGFVLKIDAGAELRSAIEAVLQNKRYLSRSLRRLHSATTN